MKNPFIALILVISSFFTAKAQPFIVPDSIVSNVHFLGKQNLSAKDYLISLFDQYDIVIFCERTHDELTQYELLTDLFSDSRFYNQVGDIFMELGVSNYDDEINNYLLSENLSQEQSNKKALGIQRNASWYPLWSRYNQHFLLTSLYQINKKLPIQLKIKLHPSDISIDWNEIKTVQDVISKIANQSVQVGRDSVIGNNIVSYITRINASPAKRRKYFVILNSAHATRGIWTLGDISAKSAASYIFEKFGDRVANVLVNFESLINMTSTTLGLPETLPILNGKLDAAFELLGMDDKGFDIKGSPLENERFENAPMQDSTLTNEKVFTGFVFYKSYPGQSEVNGVPGLVDENFKPELVRRYKLWQQMTNSFPSDGEFEDFNRIIKKSPDGLVTYWQKVMYWIGGGKGIFTFYKSGQPINETVSFIKQERMKGSNSVYNVSEFGINTFGYGLLLQGHNEEAATILLLNTQFFPNSWNTYDSYGDALLKLDRKEEAIKAYKKSLELNPGNEKARMILEKLE
ncbi:MAG: tetratricopeptide repeat protein [Ginsengibacter sp.]